MEHGGIGAWAEWGASGGGDRDEECRHPLGSMLTCCAKLGASPKLRQHWGGKPD